MGESCLKKIKKIDVFGTKKGISYNGDEDHKTFGGVCISIIYFIIVIFIAYHFITKALFGSPHIAQGIFKEDELFLHTSSDEFLLSFAVFNREKKQYLENSEVKKYFNFELKNCEKKNNELILKGRYFTSDFTSCDDTEDFLKYYDGIGKIIKESEFVISEKSICFNKKTDLIWEGQPLDKNQTYTEIKFVLCQGSHCASDLENTINSIEIEFYFLQPHMSLADKTHPFEYRFNKKYSFNLDKDQNKGRQFYFKKLIIDDDKGLIFSHSNEHESFLLQDFIPKDTPRIAQSDPYLTITLGYSGKTLVTKREYKKIQDVIGDIGGNTGLIAAIFLLFYSGFNQIVLKIQVFNQTVYKAKKMKIGFWEVMKFYLFKFCCCCKKKKKGVNENEFEKKSEIFFRADEKFENCLDVVDMIKLQGEFELMKRAIFEKNQKILLENYSSKKTFLFEEQDDEDEKEIDNKIEVEEAQEWIRNRNSNKSEFDQRVNKYLLNFNNEREEEVNIEEKESERKKINSPPLPPKKKCNFFFISKRICQ